MLDAEQVIAKINRLLEETDTSPVRKEELIRGLVEGYNLDEWYEGRKEMLRRSAVAVVAQLKLQEVVEVEAKLLPDQATEILFHAPYHQLVDVGAVVPGRGEDAFRRALEDMGHYFRVIGAKFPHRQEETA